MFFVTRPMAARFEALAAELARRCARDTLEIGGGVAAFAGVGSPLTHAAGLGMSSAVSDADLKKLEGWYGERGSATAIEVCPLADPAFLCALGRRRYLITETSNFLVRRLQASEDQMPPPGIEVREEADAERWSELLARGFFDHEPLPGELKIGLDLFRAEGFRCFTAMIGGEVAGGGAIAVVDQMACLCADATVAPYRGRGLQLGLIRTRLAEAVRAGCELAVAETAPGTPSQRNYQRCGFEVAWTKMTFVREEKPDGVLQQT